MRKISVMMLLTCLWFIDRIEGEWAVLVSHDGFSVTIPVADLPDGVGEGECYPGDLFDGG